ncbi:Pleckstrin homology-like domain [Globisporangium polare]
MTRQGYLILHEKRSRPKIFYFSLEDGFFRYYASAQCTKCLGEFKLSGSKIAVKAQKRHDAMPHSFFLETRRVFVKDRSYTLGNPVRVELSACNNDDRQEWGKALFSWQRYYWRDPRSPGEPETPVANDDVIKTQLEELVEKFYPKENPSAYSLSFASAKQPLSFIRRNAYSLRRSLSFSMMSTASTPSTASSSTSSSSSNLAAQTNNQNQQQQQSAESNNKNPSNKSKADATCSAEPTDCAKDKIVLAKVSCREAVALAGGAHVAISHRSNNQEYH